MGLNTDNYSITEHILLMHGIRVRVPDGPLWKKVAYCNSAMEGYLRHRKQQWEERGADSVVWPSRIVDNMEVARQVNAVRTGVLVKMQERLRVFISAGENATRCISTAIRVSITFSQFCRIVGIEHLDDASECTNRVISVHYLDVKQMDVFFPPTETDLASAHQERWYEHRWSNRQTEYRRVVEYVPEKDIHGRAVEVADDEKVAVTAHYSFNSSDCWLTGSWANYRYCLDRSEWLPLS
jgi:hypothetical protein